MAYKACIVVLGADGKAHAHRWVDLNQPNANAMMARIEALKRAPWVAKAWIRTRPA